MKENSAYTLGCVSRMLTHPNAYTLGCVLILINVFINSNDDF